MENLLIVYLTVNMLMHPRLLSPLHQTPGGDLHDVLTVRGGERERETHRERYGYDLCIFVSV